MGRLSAELAAANGELARRERLSLLGEVAAKLAHQLRTPLAAALLYAGHLVRPGLAEADRIRMAEKMIGRMRYLERLIQDMLLFVKGQQTEVSVFSVRQMVADLAHVIEPQAQLLEVCLEVSVPEEDVQMEAHRQTLQGALINLLENAVQASPSGGKVTFSAAVTGPYVSFRVEDEGEGISEEARARLFEPFFTTRSEGSGLGLAIVITDRGGTWRLGGRSVRTRQGEHLYALCFTPTDYCQPVTRKRSSPTVLIVEDDGALREALIDTLELSGYRVMAATQAEEAVAILERERPGVVLSDVQMPGMDGHELLRTIKAKAPGLPVVLMTAYGQIERAVEKDAVLPNCSHQSICHKPAHIAG